MSLVNSDTFYIDPGATWACISSFTFPGLTPNEELIEACYGENLGAVIAALKGGAEINPKGDRAETPLYIAAEQGNMEICTYLLEQGADINPFSDFEQTPLYVALLNNDEDITQLLINRKDRDGQTLLHQAANRGDIAQYRLLISLGASPLKLDNYGRTASQLGYSQGHAVFALEMDENSVARIALKILGHSLSVVGNVEVEGRPFSLSLSVPLLMYFPFSYAISEALDEEAFPYPILGKENAEVLHEALTVGYDKSESLKACVQAIRRCEIRFINAGWNRHSTPICIYGSYLAIGNTGRGSGKRTNHLEVFKIDPRKVTSRLLRQLAAYKNSSYATGKKYLYKTLPARLSPNRRPTKDCLCKAIERIQPIPQEEATCTYDGKRALMGFVWIMLSNPEFMMVDELVPILQETNDFLNDTAARSFDLFKRVDSNEDVRFSSDNALAMYRRACLAQRRSIEYFNGLDELEILAGNNWG